MHGGCEARVLVIGGRSHGCPFAGKHYHRLDAGGTMHLCDSHLRALLRAIKRGSADDLLERWRG